MDSFTDYEPLNTLNREIRLLTLLPGVRTDGIECSLRIEELKTGLVYEALSYVWGTCVDAEIISVNGKAFVVTKNLFDALVRLRDSSKPRVLWVDAICINQKDHIEKEFQLALMRDIYSMTTCAILWLGEEDVRPVHAVSFKQTQEIRDKLAEADALLASTVDLLQSLQMRAEADGQLDEVQDFRHLIPDKNEKVPEDDFMIEPTLAVDWTDPEFYESGYKHIMEHSAFYNDSIFHGMALLRLLVSNVCLYDIPYLKVEPITQHTHLTNARRALHWLLQRDFWTRIWCVQECILPLKATLYYGPIKVHFSMFLEAAFNLNFHINVCCSRAPGVRVMLDTTIDGIIGLNNVQNQIRKHAKVRLSNLIAEFRGRDASKKRDKIYALLPLTDLPQNTAWAVYARKGWTPSYSKAVSDREAFISSTLLIMDVEKSLDILCQLSHSPRNHNLPSWVPDYGGRAPPPPFAKNVGIYNASSRWDAVFSCVSQRYLLMRGTIVGTVNEVASGMFYHTQESKDSVLKYWWQFAREHHKLAAHIDSFTWERMFWRTVSGERRAWREDYNLKMNSYIRFRYTLESLDPEKWDVGKVPPSSASQQEMIILPTPLPLMEMRNDEFGEMARKINQTTLGRKFFLTTSGTMGIGPFFTGLEHIRKREIVVVFPGGHVPFVLRQAGEVDIEGVGKVMTHELVGECYLHGFMNGEGMERFEMTSEMFYLQ